MRLQWTVIISTRQVVIKSHRNYAFVIYKRDTLIGRHIPDNNTLKWRVWSLARVYDDGNGKQAKIVSLSFRLESDRSVRTRWVQVSYFMFKITLSHETQISIMHQTPLHPTAVKFLLEFEKKIAN